MFKAVSRGKFRQVALRDGRPAEATLYNCMVDKAPYQRGTKTYAVLDLSDAIGDLDVLRRIDEFIDATAKPEFSPLSFPLAVIKLASTAYADADGLPCEPFFLKRGDAVDVVLRPGAFGTFGYCLLLHRVKPHAVKK